jgi:nucleotide-binding universal stress UspA family protein
MPYSRALVPIDFSEGSMNILEEAVGLSPYGVCEVVALHLYDATGLEQPVAAQKKREGEQMMDVVLSKVVTDGNIVVKGDIRCGPDAKCVIQAIDELGVDLLVLGSTGKKPMEELLYGSLSEQVTRESTVPVLFIRFPLVGDQNPEQIIGLAHHVADTVIHPTDFSECSGHALDAALEFEPKRVVLATVIDESSQPATDTTSSREVASRRLQTMAKRLEKQGVRADWHVSVGDPAGTIRELAKKESATMLALGSTGKGIMTEAILGSVSASIMRSARIPVLVVH